MGATDDTGVSACTYCSNVQVKKTDEQGCNHRKLNHLFLMYTLIFTDCDCRKIRFFKNLTHTHMRLAKDFGTVSCKTKY